MSKKTRRIRVWELKRNAERQVRHLLLNKKGVSVVVSTVVLTAGVLAMSIAVLYWTYSMGKIGNLEYAKSTKASSSAIEERLAFEYISYSSSSNVLTVNIINWGKADNISIAYIFIMDTTYNHIRANHSLVLKDMNNNVMEGNALRIGSEGFVTITIDPPLAPRSLYYIRILTERGRNFDGSFATP